MRHFIVYYLFRQGINGPKTGRQTEVAFDDIDTEATDSDLRKMAIQEVDSRFYKSEDYPLYGKFWEVTDVVEINY